MSTRFDRFERLFACKRKGLFPAVTYKSPSPTVHSSELGRQFSSPPFIRPKDVRMCARDEVCLMEATCRSPSVPANFTSQGSIRGHLPTDGSTGSSCSRKGSICSTSLDKRRQDRLFTGLCEFQFPKPTFPTGQVSPQSSISSDKSSEAPRISSPRSWSPLHMKIPPYGTDTPPFSALEDNANTSKFWKTKKRPEIPPRASPTPDESPQLKPLPAPPRLPQLRHLQLSSETVFNDSSLDLGDALESVPMRRSNSEQSLAPSEALSTSCSVLREPDVNEFFSLSDDDIAENAGEILTELAIGSQAASLPQPLATTLLTLAPPRASQPATAAAYVAARIAKKYDFDLVYIVNLWPGPAMETSGESPLNGRLLAAHGLHHVASPLQISSLVHTTVLRSDGWIKYRNADARSHDFACGYVSAFYTGRYARSLSGNTSAPVSGVRLSQQIDRGIVFAAYRKPRPGGGRLGHSCDDNGLGELHGDAESLVEMLIDIHATNRLRQSTSEETGPMPLQQVVAI